MAQQDKVLKEMADEAGIPYTGAVDQPEQDPEVTRNDMGDWLFTWETDNGEYLRISCYDVAVDGTELQAQITVAHKKHKGAKPRTLLSRKRWVVRSSSSTSNLFRELNRWKMETDWHTHLTYVSDYLEHNFESGEPFLWLDEVEDPGPVSYLIEPLVQADEHTLIGARGGSLKSYTALALCLTAATGVTIIPDVHYRSEQPVKCLYLDYETNKTTHRRRLHQLAKPRGISVPKQAIGYKRMFAPLAQLKSEIRRLIAAQGIQLVVVDSVGRAVGGETVAESEVQAYYNAAAGLGATVLSIGHTSKTNTETVAGNSQWENQARSMWIFEAATEHGSNSVVVGMHHRKVNEGGLLPSMTYVVSFDQSGSVAYATATDEDVQQMQGVDLKTAIRIFLAEQPNSTAREISEALGKTDRRILNVLNRWAGELWSSDGGRPAKWLLIHPMNTPGEPSKGGDIIYPPTPVAHGGSEKRRHEEYRRPYKDGEDEDVKVLDF